MASCYARIFLEAAQVDAAQQVIDGVLNAEGFTPELSLLAEAARQRRQA